jgi:hypothetical protein
LGFGNGEKLPFPKSNIDQAGGFKQVPTVMSDDMGREAMAAI